MVINGLKVLCIEKRYNNSVTNSYQDTNLGEQGRLEPIEVKITEKADAVPRERIRAVGMCFYTPVRELVPGNSYRLCRNPQNPQDVSSIEIKDGTSVRALELP